MSFRKISLFTLMTVLLSITFMPLRAQDKGVVNVYSSRHYGAIETAFDKFTQTTGIQVRVSQGSPQELLERLRAEGEYSPADVFLTVDAGTLSLASEEGLLQPVQSDILDANIPEDLRAPDGTWYALSERVRGIAYNPETVDPSELSTYADLANPKWQGRMCMRPGVHIYTISLISSLIFNLGEADAEKVVAGWVANAPLYINSDERMLDTVAAGGCDIALVNHYYWARNVADDPKYPVQFFFPNQDTTGAFFNINGAGVTASAINVDNAITFLEYLSSVDGQAGDVSGFPGSNYEYPVNPEATINSLLTEQFGEVKLDMGYKLWDYGQYQQPAIDLMEKVGYGFDENQ